MPVMAGMASRVTPSVALLPVSAPAASASEGAPGGRVSTSKARLPESAPRLPAISMASACAACAPSARLAVSW